jgi:hypothetical protein
MREEADPQHRRLVIAPSNPTVREAPAERTCMATAEGRPSATPNRKYTQAMPAS